MSIPLLWQQNKQPAPDEDSAVIAAAVVTSSGNKLKKHNPGCNCCDTPGVFDFHGHITDQLANGMRTDLFFRTPSMWTKDKSFITDGPLSEFTDSTTQISIDDPKEWPQFSYSSINENEFTEFDPDDTGRPDTGGFLNAATIIKTLCPHNQAAAGFNGENTWFIRVGNIDTSYARAGYADGYYGPVGVNLLSCPNDLDNKGCSSNPWTSGDDAVYTDINNVDLLYATTGTATTGVYLEQEFTVSSDEAGDLETIQVMVIAQRATVNWIKLSVENVQPFGTKKHAFAWYDLENLLVGHTDNRIAAEHPVDETNTLILEDDASVEMAGSDHIACFMTYTQYFPTTPSKLKIQLVTGDLYNSYDGASGDGAHIYSASVRTLGNLGPGTTDICNVDMTTSNTINRQFVLDPDALMNEDFRVYAETGYPYDPASDYDWWYEEPDQYGRAGIARGWPLGPNLNDMVKDTSSAGHIMKRVAEEPRHCMQTRENFITESGDLRFSMNFERWTLKKIHSVYQFFNGPLSCVQCGGVSGHTGHDGKGYANIRFLSFGGSCGEDWTSFHLRKRDRGQDSMITYHSESGDITSISGVSGPQYLLEYPNVGTAFYNWPADECSAGNGWGTAGGTNSDRMDGQILPRIRLASPHDYPNVWSEQFAKNPISHDYRPGTTCEYYNSGWFFDVSYTATSRITFGSPNSSSKWEEREFGSHDNEPNSMVNHINWPVIYGSRDIFWENSYTRNRMFYQFNSGRYTTATWGHNTPTHPCGGFYDGGGANARPSHGGGENDDYAGPTHAWSNLVWADSSTHGTGITVVDGVTSYGTTRGACIVLDGHAEVEFWAEIIDLPEGADPGQAGPSYGDNDAYPDGQAEYVHASGLITHARLIVGPVGNYAGPHANVSKIEEVQVWRDSEVWPHYNTFDGITHAGGTQNFLRGLLALNATEEEQTGIINSQGNQIGDDVESKHLFAYFKKRYTGVSTIDNSVTGVGWELNVVKGDGTLVWSIEDNTEVTAGYIPPLALKAPDCYASSDRFFYVRGFPLESTVMKQFGASGWSDCWAFSHYEPKIRFPTRYEDFEERLDGIFDPIGIAAEGAYTGKMAIDSIKNSQVLNLVPALPESGVF
tara:strand:+ start:8596 stop:11934 length:3339 start_codon:yes stop_codon:yes gene_type:complete